MIKSSLIIGATVVTVVAGSLIATSAFGPAGNKTATINKAARTLFEATDFDNNQRLEEDEFAAGFNIVMNRSDRNGDGLVSWSEFYNHAVKEYRPARQYVGIAQTRFTSGDQNSDGAIGTSESRRMQMHMFRLLDKNRDAYLAFDELNQSAIGLQFLRE